MVIKRRKFVLFVILLLLSNFISSKKEAQVASISINRYGLHYVSLAEENVEKDIYSGIEIGIGNSLMFGRYNHFYGVHFFNNMSKSNKYKNTHSSIIIDLIFSDLDIAKGIIISGIFAKSNSFKGLNITGLYSITEEEINGVSICMGFSHHKKMNGISITGLLGGADTIKGIWFSGLYSKTRNVEGLSFSALFNDITISKGIQSSVFYNRSILSKGVQLGIINMSGHIYGLQLGLINYSETTNGFQIGLLNINENRWLPIINWGFD